MAPIKEMDKTDADQIKLANEVVDKMHEALLKKQKCLEYEDKILDKLEQILAKVNPNFWKYLDYDAQDPDMSEEEEGVWITNAKGKNKL